MKQPAAWWGPIVAAGLLASAPPAVALGVESRDGLPPHHHAHHRRGASRNAWRSANANAPSPSTHGRVLLQVERRSIWSSPPGSAGWWQTSAAEGLALVEQTPQPAAPASAGATQAYCKKVPQGPLQVGDKVDAKWGDEGAWYTATVTAVMPDGSYEIAYANGRKEHIGDSKRLMKSTGFHVDEVVEAQWKGLSTWYVAQIIAVNADGTYNVRYKDDGQVGKHVKVEHIRREMKGNGPQVDASEDGVCEVSGAVQDLERTVATTDKEIQKYVNRREEDGRAVVEAVRQLGPPQYAGAQGLAGADLERYLADVRRRAALAGAPSPAAASGAPSGALGGPTYAQRTAGTCTDIGGRNITTAEECAAAALMQGLGGNATVTPDGRGGVPNDPPYCFVSATGLMLDAKGANTAACSAASACLCGLPETPGYKPTDPSGACRTVNGSDGTFRTESLEANQCQAACNAWADCLGFEVGPNKHCELHATPVVAGIDANYACFQKLPAPSPSPAAAGDGGGLSGMLAAAGQGVDLGQTIQDMRREIVGRTEELIRRAEARGAFEWQLEELRDMLREDQERLSWPVPSTPEEMIHEIERLSEVIMDRAKRLEEDLEEETDMVISGRVPKPTDIETEKLAEQIGASKGGLQEALERLRRERRLLEARGQVDPELRRKLDELEEAAVGAAKNMGQVTDATGRGGRLSGRTLDDNIMKAGSSLHKVLRETQGFAWGVIPGGEKWWRFRWEYSFVEALIICLLCLLAAIWQKILDLFRESLSRQVAEAPVFITDNFPHVALATWVRFFWHELAVLLLVTMTVWLLARTGIFDLWVQVQFIVFEGIHMPEESFMYVDLVFNVAFQLIAAVILFFFLTLQICYRAIQNDRDCRCMEMCQYEDLARHPVCPSMMGKFASSPEEYAALKKGWLQGVAQRTTEMTPRGARGGARQVCAALDERGVLTDSNHNAFPLWFFISQRVRLAVERTFMITPLIWLILFVTFACFAIMHGLFEVDYIGISVVLAALSVSAFIYMIFVIRRYKSVHDDDWTSRTSPMLVVACFQFPLFFLCFVTTRLVVSVWMWVFFFETALLGSILLAVFLIVFPIFVAPLVVTYLIKTSFPPHTNGTANLIREAMDENELAKLQEDLRRRVPMTPRTSPRLSMRQLVL